MEDLKEYISGLLFIHDCVILPGFGGFVTNYHSAEHNELNHTFSPPKKDILFNKSLTYNDGLLINYLATSQNISYEEAEQKIKKEVQDAWLKLEKNQEVHFEGIGSFRYDKNMNLIFSPELTDNFLIDSYGLSSFRFPPLNYQKNAHTLMSTYNSQSMNNSGFRQTIKWAAILVPVAGIIALVPVYKNYKTQQAATLNPFHVPEEKPIEETYSAMPSDSVSGELVDQTTDKRVALFYAEENKVKEVPQQTEGLTFYIIAGSFKDEVHAKAHASQFVSKGYHPEILEEDGLFRVSLCSFDSKVNALHELRKIRSDENNDKVWLLSK